MNKKIPIKDFDDYFVTNNGDIFSKKSGKYKKLKPIINANGYCTIGLRKNNKTYIKFIHRIVAETFLLNPDHKITVNHKNGIKQDNRVQNLEWNTYSENLTHRYRVLGYSAVGKGKTGKECKNSKIVVQMKDGKPIKIFWSAHEAERKTGVNVGHICMCCRNERKHAGGFQWKYKDADQLAEEDELLEMYRKALGL